MAPVVGSYAPAFTDDVEGYAGWTINNIGGWTTYDGDGAPGYTIQMMFSFAQKHHVSPGNIYLASLLRLRGVFVI